MVRFLAALIALSLASSSAFAITSAKTKKSSKKLAAKTAAARNLRARKPLLASYHQPVNHFTALRVTRKRYYNPWTEPTFADSTAGDLVDGEDLVVRRAAVQALGPYNGTVVAVDPQTGRILTVVNQKLAYRDGFEPCSTIKLVAALAGLNEGLIDRTTLLHITRRGRMDLTDALAHSNNFYFATVGTQLGFDRVEQYAKKFGLGEKATLNVDEEQPGTLPDAPPEIGGVGMMTSFGSGIKLTPLQLAALVSTIANGGTLYYLQHPKTPDEVNAFVPRVKRQVEIAQWLPDIKPGMMGAVEYGTARRAGYNENEPIYGKTGTCSDEHNPGIHLGWFGSFNEVGQNKLVVVVLLTGGRPVSGPAASGVAGAVYRNLSEEGYFNQPRTVSPLAFVSTQACCR